MTDRYLLASAELSACGVYRYVLTRVWDGSSPRRVLFVMLNPSTADGAQDDPTVRKCVGFASRWGYGSMEIVNLYAFRARDPAALGPAGPDAIGPMNNQAIMDAQERASLVVAAWGAHAKDSRRVASVCDLIGRSMQCLGLTDKTGQPRHPLMVAYARQLVPYLHPAYAP